VINIKRKNTIKIIITVLSILTLILTGCSKSNHSAGSSKKVSTSKVTTKKNQQVSAQHQKIKITINGTILTAHLNNSSAAQAFAKELPVDLKFRDFMDMPEKVADLNHKLPTKGMPSGHAGTKGSIGYWSPERRIVFYWGTEDYYEGIHIIGKFDNNDYQKVVKSMGNNVTVNIEKVNK